MKFHYNWSVDIGMLLNVSVKRKQIESNTFLPIVVSLQNLPNTEILTLELAVHFWNTIWIFSYHAVKSSTTNARQHEAIAYMSASSTKHSALHYDF